MKTRIDGSMQITEEDRDSSGGRRDSSVAGETPVSRDSSPWWQLGETAVGQERLQQ